VVFSSDFSVDETGYFYLWEEFSRPDPIEFGWDPTRGSTAPGSLRIVVPDQGQAIALGECLAVIPTAVYRIEADILSVSEAVSPPACVIAFHAYTEPGCGGVTGQVPGANPSTGFEWEFVEFEMGPLGDDFWRSTRAMLVERNPLSGLPASCNFDNLRISVVMPAAVPAVGAVGTAALISMVVLVGVVLAARVRR
jgi:hypothetical protein